MEQFKYKTLEVNGVNIAYREAGNPENPTIVLLHGYPSSSHQYRKVLAQLSDEYHLVAPDYPGFGNRGCVRFGFCDVIKNLSLSRDCLQLFPDKDMAG